MDGGRLDAITRTLATSGSRRRTLGGLLGGTLALLGAAGRGDATAHEAARRCGAIGDRARRRGCLERARRHDRGHAAGTVSCSAASVERCAVAASEEFAAAAAPCRAACMADPEGAACAACLGPAVVDVAATLLACAVRLCP